jgi:chromatin remodeling complex protein RSC6
MASIQESIGEQFSQFYTTLSSVSTQTKSLSDQVRTLQKSLRSASKQARASQKKNQEPMNLSKDLAKFLSVGADTKLTKAEVMKTVSEYIKTHNLQVETDKRRFTPDTKLSKVFGMKKGDSLTFVEINKHVSGHLTKASASA